MFAIFSLEYLDWIAEPNEDAGLLKFENVGRAVLVNVGSNTSAASTAQTIAKKN